MSVVTLLLTAVAGFLAFWAGVVSLIGFMGWKPLAARYPAERWPDGEGVRMGWQSARVGLSNYNGALNAVVTADGLYLRPVRVFAYNHPPVFIPWRSFVGLRDGLFGAVVVELEGGGGLRLAGQLAREVRARYGAAVGDDSVAQGRSLDGVAADDGRTPRGTWRRTRAG